MDYKVVVMRKGEGFEGIAGRLATKPDDSEHTTPVIEIGNRPYYPQDVLWVYGFNKQAREAAQEAGYMVRNVLGNVMWIDV